MNFKVHLNSWLAEINTKYGYSHIEKAFTHLYIREFRDDHKLSEKFIRDHVVDNANDLGVDAIYVNDKDDLILIQSKYSYGDALLKKEIDKADSFISKYYGVNGRKENLLDKANSALKKILSTEVFTRKIKEVRFIYLCGSFSKEITSTLKNLESKFQNIPQDFYLDMYDIKLLDELYDPYSVDNQCDINVIGKEYYEHPEHSIEIEDNKEYKIRTKALVFTAQASSLKTLYEKWGDSLFEANVRNFLSFRKPINKSIKLEVEKNNRSNLWYYNNGLVAICEGFENKGTHIETKNLQIVNGGQTVRTIANVKFVEGSLGINVKLISVENSREIPSDVRKQFMTELAVNSNKQNPISTRDLKSNDIIQRELQKRFKEYNCFYK